MDLPGGWGGRVDAGAEDAACAGEEFQDRAVEDDARGWAVRCGVESIRDLHASALRVVVAARLAAVDRQGVGVQFDHHTFLFAEVDDDLPGAFWYDDFALSAGRRAVGG
ncbi:hypothetical protein E0H92_24035 [Kribbella speibonae]|uniref:Uncharacterized protein n=1 Tax=Kribbella speibonae TaxID=1572660 RepID=A0A4R0ISU3_9ACTN|nr:hypothetical protein E0H92_24035 [Kribbella speibonae]